MGAFVHDPGADWDGMGDRRLSMAGAARAAGWTELFLLTPA